MKKTLLALTVLMLTNFVKAQPNVTAKNWYVSLINPMVIKAENKNFKELGYAEYDSVQNTLITRLDQKYVLYKLWQLLGIECEIAAAAAAVAEQINDDGTVKEWPKLSDALDRWKIVKAKYWASLPIFCR